MANINADVTLRRLIAEFDEWAGDHKMLNDFGYGQYLEVFRSTGRDYAVMVVNSPTATSSKWYINYSIEVICLDWVKDEKANQDRVNSDTIAIIRDLENTIRYSNRWQAFSRVDADFSYRKVDEFGADKAFGWIATFTLKIKKRHGICEIENLMPQYDFETQGQVGVTCADATYQNSSGSFIQAIASGASFTSADIEVTVNTVSQGNFATNEDIDITVTITPPVYYNRPYLTQTTSYNTNDEAYRRINGANDYNDAIPAGAVVQQIEPDFANGRYDYLRHFNVHGHKFQYTGIDGGYYDPFDDTYRLKDGTLSDQATVFPVVSGAQWWVENHLNGGRMISDRSGSQTWVQAMDSPDTFSFDGVTVGWLNFIKDEAQQLNNNSNDVESIFMGNPDRPFFVYSQPEQWTGTTRANLITQALSYIGGTSGGTINSRTKTQSVQRWHFIYHYTGAIPQP